MSHSRPPCPAPCAVRLEPCRVQQQQPDDRGAQEGLAVLAVGALTHPQPVGRQRFHPGGIGNQAPALDRAGRDPPIVTNDLGQLNDPEETRAIRKSGMHHIRYTVKPGRDGLGRAMGAILAAAGPLFRDLEADVLAPRGWTTGQAPKGILTGCSRCQPELYPGAALPVRVSTARQG